MNKEKAKEIVIKGELSKLEKDKSYQLEEIISLSTAKWKEFHEAKGYLEAVEKFREVVKKAKAISLLDMGDPALNFESYQEELEEALAKLEKDV